VYKSTNKNKNNSNHTNIFFSLQILHFYIKQSFQAMIQ